MKIIRDYRDFPSTLRSTLTIGNFDGLHLGHRRLLRDMVATARQSGTVPVLVTFAPHPLKFLNPSKAPKLLFNLQQKSQQVGDLGVEYILVLRFDEVLSKLSGEEFIRKILVDHLRVMHVFVGREFVFGHHRSGNVSLLKEFGERNDFRVHVVPPVSIRGTRVSSTWLRDLIEKGKMSLANRLMERCYSVAGRVTAGAGLGRTVLFPTLNLKVDSESEILPARGVYVTLANFGGRARPAVTNIGIRPTVGGTQETIETHVLDEVLEYPPDFLEIQFLHRLRNEQKFPSVAALREQIHLDIRRAARFFRLLALIRNRPKPTMPLAPS